MMGQIHPSDGSRVEFIKRVAKILRILLVLVFDVYRTHRLGTVKLKQYYSCFSVFNNSL